jgi:hypothetical protein
MPGCLGGVMFSLPAETGRTCQLLLDMPAAVLPRGAADAAAALPAGDGLLLLGCA